MRVRVNKILCLNGQGYPSMTVIPGTKKNCCDFFQDKRPIPKKIKKWWIRVVAAPAAACCDPQLLLMRLFLISTVLL